jgi:hypothetical protein
MLTFADESVAARLHASAARLDAATIAALGTLASDSAEDSSLTAATVSALLGPHGQNAAATLVDAGLLTATRSDGGSRVYHLHPLVRAFAADLASHDARWRNHGSRVSRSAVS